MISLDVNGVGTMACERVGAGYLAGEFILRQHGAVGVVIVQRRRASPVW